MNKRNPLKEITFWVYLSMFCLVLLFFVRMAGDAFASHKNSVQLNETTATVEKVIMSGKDTYVYLKYKVEGVYYEDIRVKNVKNLKEGDTVTVYYNPENPFDASSVTFNKPYLFNNYIGAIIVLPIVVVTFIPIFKYIRVLMIHNYLAEHGEHIRASVISVRCNRKTVRNRNSMGRKRYKIYTLKCEGRYHGKLCTFIKNELYFKPMYEEGSAIDVYVDPQNPDRYYVDCGLNAADAIYSSIKGAMYEMNNKGTTSVRQRMEKSNIRSYDSYNDYNSNNFNGSSFNSNSNFNNYNNSSVNNSYGGEDYSQLSSKISTSTFANDFDDFMNDLEKKE